MQERVCLGNRQHERNQLVPDTGDNRGDGLYDESGSVK